LHPAGILNVVYRPRELGSVGVQEEFAENFQIEMGS